jgi:hypothetical protein
LRTAQRGGDGANAATRTPSHAPTKGNEARLLKAEGGREAESVRERDRDRDREKVRERERARAQAAAAAAARAKASAHDCAHI